MLTLRRLALPSILVVGTVLALGHVNQHLILASDNASYVVLGQALALGRGYVMINEPTAPPMNLYPFGYPLLLAAVLRLTGAAQSPMQAIVAMKLVAVVFFLLSLPVLYALVQRRHGHLLASLTTLLVAINPSFLILSSEILSETPFVFFTLLALLLVEEWQEQDTRGAVHLTAAALSLAVAYYMRTAAIAILAAVPVYLLWRRYVRAAAFLAIILLALALPWLVRSSSTPTAETPFFARSYIHQVLALAPYSDKTATPLDLALRVVRNSWTYASTILPETMFPHIPSLGILARPVALAMVILMVAGLILELRRGLRVGEAALVVYWLSLSLFVWVLGFRYIIVVLPFVFLYLLVALRHMARWSRVERLAPRLSTLLPLLVAVVLAVSGLAVDARRIERNLCVTRHQTLAQAYARDLEWTHYLAAADWLRQNTPPRAVVMARKPDLLYLLTGHPTVEYPYTQDGSKLLSVMQANQVAYVLEDGFTWTRTTETYLAPAMSSLPGRFTLRYETPAPRTRIWQVIP